MTDDPPTPLPYADRPEISEIFADQIRLTHFDGYSVRLEFAVVRPYLAGQDRAEATLVPAARLVLSPHAAIGLRDQLVQLLATLEQQGVLRRVAPASSSRQ
jgi:hypothetical protein